jgi:SAM-dependent methyltransferase
MTHHKVNYDQIAQTYDRRFIFGQSVGVARALGSLLKQVAPERVLEVGCGTGHWLLELKDAAPFLFGLDLSSGMLQTACRHGLTSTLIRGDAGLLPFPNETFDLLYCVNAFHHFASPREFIQDARRILRRGGALSITGMDPHSRRGYWYIYDYFPRTKEIDLARFPSVDVLIDWMLSSGFKEVDCRPAEHIRSRKVGDEVLEDAFLQKNSTSQLVLLTDEEYAAGLALIKADLSQAKAVGKEIEFLDDTTLMMVTAWV